MKDGDGNGDGNGGSGGDGIGVKQSYAASSLKLHVYGTINQNLQNISLSLSKLQHHLNFRLKGTKASFN